MVCGHDRDDQVRSHPHAYLCLVTPEDIKFRVNQSEGVLAITTLEHVTKVAEVKQDCPSLKHLSW